MVKWWDSFSKRPFVAHLLRAVDRFNLRGGGQLAAAISYFSVLSIVPVLMLAFSVLGLSLTVFRPQSLIEIEKYIQTQLPVGSKLGDDLYAVIVNALTNWASVLGFGIVIIIWVGSGWVGNLKRSVRLVMREDVDNPGPQVAMPLDILANFAGLVGLLVGVTLTSVASGLATIFADAVGGWLGVGGSSGWTALIRLLGLVISLVAGTGLFRLLFAWFSPHRVPSHLAWVGSAIGAAGLLVLQALTGYLIGTFSANLGFAVFGSTIVLMLFLNLFATLLLYIAAWLATAAVPAIGGQPVPVVDPRPLGPAEARPGERYVSSELARRTLGIGLNTGYVVGAATGVGIGAAIAALLGRRAGRRR